MRAASCTWQQRGWSRKKSITKRTATSAQQPTGSSKNQGRQVKKPKQRGHQQFVRRDIHGVKQRTMSDRCLHFTTDFASTCWWDYFEAHQAFSSTSGINFGGSTIIDGPRKTLHFCYTITGTCTSCCTFNLTNHICSRQLLTQSDLSFALPYKRR